MLVRLDGTSVRTPILRGNRYPSDFFVGRWFRSDQYEMLLAELNRRLRERDFAVGHSPQ